MRKHNWILQSSPDEVVQKNIDFWRTLSKQAYPLTHGEISIPISLEPFVISPKEYADFYANLQLFTSAAQKIAQAYFSDEEIRKIVVLNEQERVLVEESINEDFVGIVRPDLFWSKNPRLVEINADFPDGFFMHDVTATALLDAFDHGDMVVTPHDMLFSQLLEAQGLDYGDHIFVGYNKDRFFIDEFCLTKLKLEALGWKNVSVGAFENLSYSEHRFYYDGRPVALIRRGAELFKMRRIPGLIENLVSSQKAGNIKIINNFKNRLLGHKSLLAALSDTRFHHYLRTDEIRAIATLLPTTVKLSGENYTWAKEHQNTLVLKPSDLAEGEGIFIGSNLDPDAWGTALDVALKNSQFWILQEKITIPEEEFMLVDRSTGAVTVSTRKYDFDPHLIMFKDRVEMGRILVRFSESSILNVMQGGGLTYAFIEKE